MLSLSLTQDKKPHQYTEANTYCNNCGKPGHIFHQCKMPIMSIGIIAFRVNRERGGENQYLMIRRKDTLGHIDFMRGKYSVYNKYYIMNMLKQMTRREKELLKTENFDTIWNLIWDGNPISNQYKNEEAISREKFNSLVRGVLVKNEYYTLTSLVEESEIHGVWEETEWGFPKGRRNYQEKDFDCAVREFCEETGYSKDLLKPIQNVLPYEEIFTGSNYKSYKHKYYLMCMEYGDTLNTDGYERTEVSKMEWKTYDECINSMRDYNLEKKAILTNVDKCLRKYSYC